MRDLLPNRFSSLDVVTNILRTRRKYQTSGGTNTNVTGCFSNRARIRHRMQMVKRINTNLMLTSTATAETKAPRTKNEMTRKSKRVVGNWSSLLPTSIIEQTMIDQSQHRSNLQRVARNRTITHQMRIGWEFYPSDWCQRTQSWLEQQLVLCRREASLTPVSLGGS